MLEQDFKLPEYKQMQSECVKHMLFCVYSTDTNPQIYFHLSICLSVYLHICLVVQLSFCISVYLSMCLTVNLSIRLSVYLSICLFVYLSICLSVYLSICLSVYLSICLFFDLSICLLFIYLSESQKYSYICCHLPIQLLSYLSANIST